MIAGTQRGRSVSITNFNERIDLPRRCAHFVSRRDNIMSKYQFINANLSKITAEYLLADEKLPSDLYGWLEEIVEAGFKVSMRYNPDYRGYSVTVSDVLSDPQLTFGISGWGGSLDEALTQAYLLVDVIAERGDFLRVPSQLKEIEKDLLAKVRTSLGKS
jgi:hypothetical protein